MSTLPLTTTFDAVPDPRRTTANKLHPLTDILVLATCAVLGGANTWDAIALFGRSKETFFRRFLTLPHGIPSPDTFERVFAKLSPQAFSQAFTRWMASACETTGLVPIAVDGKSLRSSPKNTATGCLHLVSAWATQTRMTLGQVSVPEGSNEIAAIPALLQTLDLAGAIVTIDAAGCQLENARIIRDKGGDYLFAVKGNQPHLLSACEELFDRARDRDFVGLGMTGHESTNGGHGRREERYITVLPVPEGFAAEWPDVRVVMEVNRVREVKGTRTQTTQYYVGSHLGTAEELGGCPQGHWGIESMHWVLDVVYREDDSRVRAGHAGENLGLVRRVAVSLMARAPGKESGVCKRLRAGWDDDYLLQILQGFPAIVVR